MKITKQDMLLYLVTDRTWLAGRKLADLVEQSIKAGATFVQLREKELPFDEFVVAAKEVKKITDLYKIPFVINDNVEVALAVDADGVHVGQTDLDIAKVRQRLGNGKIIGISTETVELAMQAEQCDADYIGVGAVFATTTKLDARNLSFGMLKNICNSVSLPSVAIGGISSDNILKLSGSGVCGVAVISAILAQKDITAATNELLNLSKQMVLSQ